MNVSTLAPGQSFTGTVKVSVPASISGTYYWRARADGAGQVQEPDETNNNLVGNAVQVLGASAGPLATYPLFLALLVLMSLAPLFAWRKQPFRTLLKALRVPLMGSLIITAVWGYAHRMHPASIVGLWMVSFGAMAIGYEYWKGVRARMAAQHENPIAALVNLVSRNRRRYGGYLIHLGVIMIALAFVGEAFFKQETQGTLAAGQRLSVGNYSLEFNTLREYPGSDGRDVVEATTTLYQGDQLIGQFNTRLRDRQIPPDPGPMQNNAQGAQI